MSKTALFIIDIQNDLAKNPTTKIPPASRINSSASQVIAAARKYIDLENAATDRKVSLNLYFVQHEEDAEQGPLIRGSQPWELVFEPDYERGEVLIGKTTRDTFSSEARLAAKLKGLGVKTIVAIGIQSECCVLSTCEGAISAGFDVVLLKGAHSTYDTESESAEEIESEVEARLEGKGAKVLPWEDMVRTWENGERRW